jgi:hypothetical protein
MFFLMLFRQLRTWVVPDNLGEVVHNRQRIILPVMRFFERAIVKLVQRLNDGFRKTTVRGALVQTSDSVDAEALAWWLQLPALGEKSKAQDFFAWIPQQAAFRLMRHPTGN